MLSPKLRNWIVMNRNDLSIARNFKRLVLQRLLPAEIRVFGSRARGNAVADSDLDVLVVVEEPTAEVERFVSDCAWEAGFAKDVVIVPVVVGRERLEGPLRDSAFIRNVMREGIAV